MTQPDWSTRIISVISEQIRRLRAQRGLSARQLADACEELGMPIHRNVLANLESGRRPLISVAELLVLAKALQVPPVLLVFPLGRSDEIEVLPGVNASTWEALKWFTGEEPFPSWEWRDQTGEAFSAVDDTDMEVWEQAAAPIELYRRYERHLHDWRVHRHSLELARKGADKASTDAERAARLETAETAERAARSLESTIWEVRRDIQRRGLAAPALPDALTHLNTETSPLGRAIERRYRQETEE